MLAGHQAKRSAAPIRQGHWASQMRSRLVTRTIWGLVGSYWDGTRSGTDCRTGRVPSHAGRRTGVERLLSGHDTQFSTHLMPHLRWQRTREVTAAIGREDKRSDEKCVLARSLSGQVKVMLCRIET